METLTPVLEIVEQAKAHTQRNSAQLLHTFSFVPEDKLTWSPATGAKTALGIVAHCGLVNPAFAMLIRNEMPSEMPAPEQMMAMMAEREKAITSREQAIQHIETSTAEVLAALDQLTHEDLALSPNSPFGAMPMMFWMFLPGNHMLMHAAQIDYLQTIWGDYVPHFVG